MRSVEQPALVGNIANHGDLCVIARILYRNYAGSGDRAAQQRAFRCAVFLQIVQTRSGVVRILSGCVTAGQAASLCADNFRRAVLHFAPLEFDLIRLNLQPFVTRSTLPR